MPKLKFTRDGFVDGKCIYPAGTIHEIGEASVDRWVRRGAVVIESELAPELTLPQAPKGHLAPKAQKGETKEENKNKRGRRPQAKLEADDSDIL